MNIKEWADQAHNFRKLVEALPVDCDPQSDKTLQEWTTLFLNMPSNAAINLSEPPMNPFDSFYYDLPEHTDSYVVEMKIEDGLPTYHDHRGQRIYSQALELE